jgi:hypothetical protein
MLESGFVGWVGGSRDRPRFGETSGSRLDKPGEGQHAFFQSANAAQGLNRLRKKSDFRLELVLLKMFLAFWSVPQSC